MHFPEVMSPHHVRLHVEPSRMDRFPVLIRLVLLVALATAGLSSFYWLLYLVAPMVVALIVSYDGADHYMEQDAPRLARILRWVAGAYAYLWLLTDAMPQAEPGGAVELEIDIRGEPDLRSAFVRVVTSLPALLVLAILSLVATVFWVFGAISILAVRRVPLGVSDFIAMKLQYQFRLIAYHLSLVDEYPSVEGLPPHDEPHSHAM
jgi:hypothetical protein